MKAFYCGYNVGASVLVAVQHNEDAKRLLDLMGVPFLEAPCEAEAQCAELVKSGKVFAAATEDMDCLTFGAPIVLRHMTFSEARCVNQRNFYYPIFILLPIFP